MGRKNIFSIILFSLIIISFFGNFVSALDSNSQNICSDSLISNYSNNLLISIFGSDWASNYFYSNYISNKILYPEVLNISNITKQSSFITTFYTFSGPKGLSTNATLTFVIPDQNYCNQLFLFHATNLIKPYDSSQIITSDIATSIANQHNFKISYSSLTLIPSTESNSIYTFLVPGYVGMYNDNIVYINAINSELSINPLIQPLNNTSKNKSSIIIYIYVFLFAAIALLILYILLLNKSRHKK